MTTPGLAADGSEEPGLHIDPDLRTDSRESWVRRFGRALVYLFRSVA